MINGVSGVRRNLAQLAAGAGLGWRFVVLGAGAQMGPFEVLLRLGAHVVAVDLPRPELWKRLIKLARESPGTLTFPTASEPDGLNDAALSEIAGADLLTDPFRVTDWLSSLDTGGDRLVIGSYAYLDSALFVRVSGTILRLFLQ